jgi:glycosyltransferase involved in cell wall biosynthesis
MRIEILRHYRRLDALAVLTQQDLETYGHALPGLRLAAIPYAVPPLGPLRPSLEDKVVIAVGRLSPQKGFDRLLDAFAAVAAKHPDWSLRICGAGRLRGELEAQIERLGLGRQARLLGNVEDIDRELASASIFVLSSRFEGLPMAMIEAMSKGLPIIAFDAPTGPGEVIEDGCSGLLISNGDVGALAAAISALIERPEQRCALGEAAARRAGDFALEAIGPMWTVLLQEVAADLRAP